ncbi:hypothetical protein TESG_05299 [Trichophyton tonsurans CBS 112818]|uniref:Uncharacterized protein n=1 Tax=Trichophyton tonsurans (strain CBS 112818) TaxID=647933 RepID=F2S362_TRIT1|nr:hypothetical protein TESG_05299 [Trichophyton tonsurans CBS 112818]
MCSGQANDTELGLQRYSVRSTQHDDAAMHVDFTCRPLAGTACPAPPPPTYVHFWGSRGSYAVQIEITFIFQPKSRRAHKLA